MLIINVRCFSGSEIALTEIDALLGVAAGTVVDDCWPTTNNNLQITTKVLIPNKSHLRMNLWPKISFKPIRHSNYVAL